MAWLLGLDLCKAQQVSRPGLRRILSAMFPRPPLLAALPWTALGVQDWRLCLIQSAAVWWLLGRDSKRRSADAALTLGLLFAALLDALLYLPDLKSAALKFVITGPVALALAAGVLGIRNGQRWALVIPAGLLLLDPTLIGVAGLLIGALGLSGPETRQPQALGPLSAGASVHGQTYRKAGSADLAGRRGDLALGVRLAAPARHRFSVTARP